MNCLNCNNIIDETTMRCNECDKLHTMCFNCNQLIVEDDTFCGNCGNATSRSFMSIESNTNDNEILEYSKDLLIEYEGNKFKAIKELKEKYDLDNDKATEYINNALNSFDNKEEVKEVTKTNTMNNETNTSNNETTFINPKGIAKVMIVGHDSRKKATSVIGRGIVGGALLGPVGLLAGASGKNKNKTTFLIIYNNGKRETITTKNNGFLYKKLIQYVE